MAEPTRAAPPAGGKGKTFLGQPAWMWAVGAGVVILGYLYIKHKSSTAAGAGQGGTKQAPQTVTSRETLHYWVGQHQGQPHRKHRRKVG